MGKPVESANECGGVSFCKTPEFAAVVHDEDIPEMKWLREAKRAGSTDGHTEDHGPYPRGLRSPRTAGDEGEEE